MMTSSGSATEMGRSDEISGLQKLRSPEEGGVKKEYDDFMEKIENHVAIKWPQGSDIAYFVKNGEDPDMDPPKDLTEDEQKTDVEDAEMGDPGRDFFPKRIDSL